MVSGRKAGSKLYCFMFLPNSVVDCGQPASPEDTVLLPGTGTTYGSVARFECDEGFLWRSGDNTSVCGADGLWRGATMVCEGNKTQANKSTSLQLLFSLQKQTIHDHSSGHNGSELHIFHDFSRNVCFFDCLAVLMFLKNV